ncbi:hypothetical protein GT037_009994 [Alternaria burnsii]|uniref:Uncharacterized protein n=1 Tax=Alternaria burnsii TaxID=1187904 RepID=A0A8H7EA22_9PLEO|nr:uncharacterized protein GT037_009994 [Alternaria burnsii]KAF7672095.1 hypothetical protein GT037_009994 [Alternaria burnsii]
MDRKDGGDRSGVGRRKAQGTWFQGVTPQPSFQVYLVVCHGSSRSSSERAESNIITQ